MEVTFLGTGAAVAPHAYNVAMVVDGTLLLDAGAPLSVHLPRAGLSVAEPRAVILTHFHADHTFGLASLILARVLLEEPPPPLSIVGPTGTRAYVRQLVEFAWGPEMLQAAIARKQVEVQEVTAGDQVQVDGCAVTAYPMTHTPRFSCLGYVIAKDGVRLGYSGDAEASAGLEALLNACDHAVVEMTYAEPGPMHLSRPEVASLVERHPRVKFLLTHLGWDGSISGAVGARDFLTVQLPLR
ncbi:MAG: ribonuclease Z [Candidatus Dormibacter sp.]